jgi:hypothetical protein
VAGSSHCCCHFCHCCLQVACCVLAERDVC